MDKHAATLQQLEQARRDLEHAHARRDALVRAAAAAGVPKTHIADAVGLSRVHVQRLTASD
ncbi:hypothetical protein [Burkholderia cenocepacia]|uniref:hypothetical protein n=1 Tax=Burkholderia cenocepacia TaxID=95486 RepID=UPI0038CC13E8